MGTLASMKWSEPGGSAKTTERLASVESEVRRRNLGSGEKDVSVWR
jgi:hypothetical protein